MQLIHVPGSNRVYNACKGLCQSARVRGTKLTDVVGHRICDFELWPDAEQDDEQHRDGAHTHAQPLEHDGDQSGNHGLCRYSMRF
jgi:hypothetical protein